MQHNIHCLLSVDQVEVMKKLSLEELPPVLVLHFKCFVYNKDGGCQKLMKKVDYKVELEITKGNMLRNVTLSHSCRKFKHATLKHASSYTLNLVS